MAGITGQGTTFNLPNFVGELFGITPEDTPFLSAIGGLTGGKSVAAKRFEWEFYDLRAAGQRDALEGANAPTAESRVRANAYNMLHSDGGIIMKKLKVMKQMEAGVHAGNGAGMRVTF